MKTVLLVFSILFLIFNLWSYKSYFCSVKKSNERINDNFDELRKKYGEVADIGVRIFLIATVAFKDILFIVFATLVELHFMRGIVMGYAAFIAAWTLFRLFPTVLQIFSLQFKRPFLSWFIHPLNTVFLSYLVYFFIQ